MAISNSECFGNAIELFKAGPCHPTALIVTSPKKAKKQGLPPRPNSKSALFIALFHGGYQKRILDSECRCSQTSLKISSSVRKPWASPKGRTSFRSARNLSTAMYRRIDSRTMSLTGLYCSSLSFCRLSLRSSGSLIVSVSIVRHRNTAREKATN